MIVARRNPLYYKIAEQIKEIADLGTDYNFLPSERDLSARLGVERMTVRRALGLLAEEGIIVSIPGRGSMVNPVRERPPARLPAGKNILFVMSAVEGEKLRHDFVANLFYRLEKLCNQGGYNIQYLNIGIDNPAQDLDKLFGEAHGIILYSKIDKTFIEAATESRKPAILISNREEGVRSIVYDNVNGCYDAVAHLMEQGCRRIAFISGAEGFLNSSQRFEGYARALARGGDGVEYDERLIVCGRWDFLSGYECMARLIDEKIGFDGVLAANDAMALGAMRALSQHDIVVPQDVKIVGFDNTESGEYSVPSLSSVSVDARTIAWLAIEMLRHIIDGDAVFDEIVVPARLIVRESSTNSRLNG
jgi:DNA-binding LacI/PurR family transcriptional regulator